MTVLVYFATIGLILGALLLIARWVTAALTARARIAAESSFQALAEKAVAQQAQNETALSSIKAELASLSASVAAVEQILRQVG